MSVYPTFLPGSDDVVRLRELADGDAVGLAEVRLACAVYHCAAIVYDASGAIVGHVDTNGEWSVITAVEAVPSHRGPSSLRPAE